MGLLDGKASTLELSTGNSVPTSLGVAPNDVHSAVSSSHHIARTLEGQILEALVDLMVTILQDVRISEDNAEKIFDLLGPLMHRKAVRGALLGYNEDASWLMERYPQ